MVHEALKIAGKYHGIYGCMDVHPTKNGMNMDVAGKWMDGIYGCSSHYISIWIYIEIDDIDP